MENQHQKFINVCYVAFSSLVAFVAFAGLMKLSGTLDWESKVKSIEYIIRGGSLVLGFTMFVGLYKNTTTNTFMSDVAVEFLTKVTWPASKDTFVATGVVIVAVVIASLVLGFFDWLWVTLIKGIL